MLMGAFGASQVTLTGSGTQALTLAIRSAFESAGDDTPSIVALPAYSCYDVATAAVGSGLSIALYDVDPDNLSPDFDSVEKLLRSGVRIFVAAHLYGQPVEWDTLERCGAPYRPTLIEDAAQGHGGRWQMKPLGSLGTSSVLSFGRGKGWTGSRGGALLDRKPRQIIGAQLDTPSFRDEASVVLTGLAQWGLSRPSCYWLPASLPWLRLGETDYHDPRPCSGMTRASARTIEETRALATTESFARRCNAWELLARISGHPQLRAFAHHPQGQPGFLRLPLRVAGGWAGLPHWSQALRLGIARGYPTTLAQVAAVRERLVGPESSWPGAETLVREIVTVPTHSRLTREDRNRLVSFFEGYAVPRGISVPLTLKA
jgi:hypothetical protein